MLQVDWNRIPGLTQQIATIPTVVILDSLWARWVTDWKDTWEPDKDPRHFIRNVALVICRSRYNNNPDIKRKDKRVYLMAIAHIPDNINPATLEEANETFQKTEPDLQSVICLTRLHKAAKFYPDYYCDRKKRQITLQHMETQVVAAGVAANFAGAKLLTTVTTSDQDQTYSKLPPGYCQGGTGDLINTGGKCFKVWESGPGKKRPDIHELPLSAATVMTPMPKYGDFPLVVIDVEPFNRWPKSRRPKEVAWIIPPWEPKQLPKPAGSTDSPAHHEDITGDSDHDSGCHSPASSWAASLVHSVGSMVEELIVSLSSESGSNTPAMSGDLSDDEGDQASGNETAGPSGNGRRSDNEGDRGEGGECRAGGHGDERNRESDDSSSDSEDDYTSDDGGGTPEAAQHLEEVYSQILKALQKTAKIMCTGYDKAASDMQGIVQVVVQEAIWPNKTYIQAATGHL